MKNCLAGKKILLGVSGSIAAYKAAEFARLCIKAGADVQVVMTPSAQKFVAPLTFFSLTGNPVYSELFSGGPEEATAHIELARKADLVVIAPATARTIGKIASGQPDDLLSTTIIAADTPVVIAPAMNAQMYIHPSVQKNLKSIASWPNYAIAPPTEGELACGEFGLGRLAEPEDLLEFCCWFLAGGKSDLSGERVLITGGPTFEDIDPIRFISNRSSGKMGWALAKVAARRGAEVTLISSLFPERPIPGERTVKVRSALQMRDAVLQYLNNATILVMAAAVADFRPEKTLKQKFKKSDKSWELTLVRNPDILATLPRTEGRITVGFAAETEALLQNAEKKLKSKKLDLIVANDVSDTEIGFGSDLNRATLIFAGGKTVQLPILSKETLADKIFDYILNYKRSRQEYPK